MEPIEPRSIAKPIISTVIISAVLFGGVGYYLGKNYTPTTKTTTTYASPSPSLSPKVSASPTIKTSPTVSPSSTSLQTYTNIKYGYSFQYPIDWEVRNLSTDRSGSVDVSSSIGVAPKTMKEDTVFLVGVTTKSITALVEAKRTADAKADSNTDFVSSSVVQKFGQSATKVVEKNKSSGLTYTTYYVQVGNSIYSITGEDDEGSINSKTKSDILSTFKFTK